VEEWAYELNREFSKEEVQMARKYVKKCSTSLVINDTNQNNQLEWPESRVITTTSGSEDMAKQESLYTIGGNAN
jgi:hypothetical protein